MRFVWKRWSVPLLAQRPLLAQVLRFSSGRACRLCPGSSDVDLFCYCKSIVNLDAKIAYCALDLGVAE